MRISDWSSDVCSSDLRQQQVASRAGLLRQVAGGAFLRLVRLMIEPALVHIAHREGHWADVEGERAGRWRDDLMTVITGTALRDDRPERRARAHLTERAPALPGAPPGRAGARSPRTGGPEGATETGQA